MKAKSIREIRLGIEDYSALEWCDLQHWLMDAYNFSVILQFPDKLKEKFDDRTFPYAEQCKFIAHPLGDAAIRHHPRVLEHWILENDIYCGLRKY
jgi:hypothetical protein